MAFKEGRGVLLQKGDDPKGDITEMRRRPAVGGGKSEAGGRKREK